MFKQDRQNGQNYADNVIDYYLYFETPQTWTASSGTGTGVLNNAVVFSGTNSLKIENTAPTTDLEITNSTQNTVIYGGGGIHELSCYLRKDDSGEPYTGHIEIFKNGSTYNTQTFTLGSDNSDPDNPDVNEKWVRFVSDVDLDFAKSDVITFKIQLDAIAGYIGASTSLWVGGMMLNLKDRENAMPPEYSKPIGDLYNLYTGWGAYADSTYTTGSPFTVTDGASSVALPNDAGSTLETQKPIDITTFYDGTVITGREGDGLNITIEFKCRPAGAGADPRLTVLIDIGGAVGELYSRDFVLNKGNGIEHNYISSFDVYTLDTWEANGGTVKVSAVNEDIEIYDIRYVLTRTHKAR